MRILALALILAACSPPHEEGKSPERLPPIRAAKVDAAAARLPAHYRFVAPGTLTVGMAASARPLADYSNKEGSDLIGVEPGLAQLIADSLGLKLRIIPIAWPDWPLGLQSGKYDVIMSNLTVTEERKQKFDFSTYRDDLLGIYTRADGPLQAIVEPRDIAGLKIAVIAGTNQSQILDRWNAQNVAAGLKPAEPQYYDDPGVARLALLSGQIDASFGPNATSAYEARDGRTRKIGTFAGGWPLTAYIAVASRKGSGLADPITAAINAQIADGAYAKLLDRWALTSEGIKRSETNPRGLPRS